MQSENKVQAEGATETSEQKGFMKFMAGFARVYVCVAVGLAALGAVVIAVGTVTFLLRWSIAILFGG